jgi:hypothetical protein
MKAKFAGEMPDFGVDPITKRAHSRQISREHKMEAMNIFYSRTSEAIPVQEKKWLEGNLKDPSPNRTGSLLEFYKEN